MFRDLSVSRYLVYPPLFKVDGKHHVVCSNEGQCHSDLVSFLVDASSAELLNRQDVVFIISFIHAIKKKLKSDKDRTKTIPAMADEDMCQPLHHNLSRFGLGVHW